MFKSIFGTIDKPKGAAPLPLAIIDLIAVNAVVQATAIGYLSALFRRDWFAPVHGMVTRLAYPVITDLVVLAALGFLLSAVTRVQSDEKTTRMDRLLAAGAPLWLGYALGLLWLRMAFIFANLPLTRDAFFLPLWVFDYVPAYRGVTELTRWHPEHWSGALVFVVVCGVSGWLYSRSRDDRTRRLHQAFRVSLILALLSSAPVVWRAHSSWRPAAAGDMLVDRLAKTPQIGASDWTPAGLRGRITLVEFWTTWCGACKRLLPQLNQLKKTIKDPQFEVLLVNVEGRGQPSPQLLDKVRKYKAERAPGLKVLVDRGVWSDAVGITVYPTLALVGPDGRLIKLWSGTPNMSSVERLIRTSLESALRL